MGWLKTGPYFLTKERGWTKGAVAPFKKNFPFSKQIIIANKNIEFGEGDKGDEAKIIVFHRLCESNNLHICCLSYII